jgi:glutamate-1-semialdehyde 2,1-aminomutase
MTAGIETITILKESSAYQELEKKSSLLEKGIIEAASKAGVDIQLPRIGSMFTIFFTKDPVTDYETAAKADTKSYAKFFHQILSQGIYFPPSQFEAAFVSVAHTHRVIQSTISAAEKAFTSLL